MTSVWVTALSGLPQMSFAFGNLQIEDVGSVTVIRVERRINKQSSNSCLVCCIYFPTDDYGKVMNLSFLPTTSYCLNRSVSWALQPWMAASLGEGQIYILNYREDNQKPFNYLA